MTDEKRLQSPAAKILMPVVAMLASAGASWVAKKGPQYLEETILPKLREAKPSLGGVGDVAHDLTERARSVVGGDDGDGGTSDIDHDDLARRRRERAEKRAGRRAS